MTASVGSVFARPSARQEPVPRPRSLLQPEEGWLSIALVLVMVFSTIWSIDQAHWVEGTGILFPAALVGFGVGYLLSRPAFAAWIAILLGVVLGAVVAFVSVGQLLPPLPEMPALFVQTVLGTFAWIGHPSGTPPLVGAFQQLAFSATDFGGRVGLWTQQGAAGRASNDNAMFLLLIAFVAWLQGLFGAWGLFRLKDVVVAALPSGIALATNAAYTGQAQAPFAIFIITLLLLAVSLNLASLQKRWERFSVDYPSGLLFDVTVSSFVVICILAVLAFFGPRVAENPLSNAFWNYMGEQWTEVENASNRLFSGVNSPQAGGAGAGRDRLVLSGPVRLTQRVVMTVQSDEPYYWRGATYDTWTGHDWLSSDKVPLSRTDKQAVMPTRFNLRKRVKATFEITQSRSDLIYTPDEPVQLSIPYKVFTRAGDPAQSDFAALRAKKPAIPSLKYSVESMVSVASAEDLRNASTDYPDWVKRYTHLPDVPPRVRELSNALTRPRRTPYEKAVAIEQFLRKYPYTLDVKAAPPDRDAIEYFLFDLKQGYCDYFASSMVVLLRAQGIPARLATGYVSGKFDNNTHKFVVTEEEAHSWPEVYFPGYGWMAFEPSGYRPPIVRPEESTAAALGDSTECYDYGDYGDCTDLGELGDLADLIPSTGDAAPVIGVYQSGAPFNWRAIVQPLGFLVVIGGAGYWLATRLSSRRRSTVEEIRRAYRRMTLYGALFGVRRKPSETPLEYARTLNAGLRHTLDRDGMVSTLRLKQFVGTPNGAAEAIASSYVRSQYSQEALTETDRDLVIDGWRELRKQLPVLLLRDRRN
jgi:transglutaminase-like putative cysteine protease